MRVCDVHVHDAHDGGAGAGWVGVRLTWRDLFCAEEGKRRKAFAKEGRKEAIYR